MEENARQLNENTFHPEGSTAPLEENAFRPEENAAPLQENALHLKENSVQPEDIAIFRVRNTVREEWQARGGLVQSTDQLQLSVPPPFRGRSSGSSLRSRMS